MREIDFGPEEPICDKCFRTYDECRCPDDGEYNETETEAVD